MEGNNIINEAEGILERKTLDQVWGYLHDPQYQELTAQYLKAVEQEDWKAAHDVLVALNLLIERLGDSIERLRGCA